MAAANSPKERESCIEGAKMSWTRFLVSWKQLTHQKERRPLFLGRISALNNTDVAKRQIQFQALDTVGLMLNTTHHS